MNPEEPRSRREWKSKLLELLMWAIVSLATAVILVLLAEKLLPSNF
jgi:hypothetical protein